MNDMMKLLLVGLALFALYYLYQMNQPLVNNEGNVEMNANVEGMEEDGNMEANMEANMANMNMEANMANGNAMLNGNAGNGYGVSNGDSHNYGEGPGYNGGPGVSGEMNAQYAAVSGMGNGQNSFCFPTPQLQADDLLPNDDYTNWHKLHPNGEGFLKNKNFLTAGHHIGINTVGQSLRNANLNLRSEPANPQISPGIWHLSTIGPDNNRRSLELGCTFDGPRVQ